VSVDIFRGRIRHKFVRAMSKELVEWSQEFREPLGNSPTGLADYIRT